MKLGVPQNRGHLVLVILALLIALALLLIPVSDADGAIAVPHQIPAH